ncbi:MAG TPA: ATP-dependent sacrificial sulfur transferase LarE [Verrucomicrobiota bacterium]|nr:ATP-dependent sacrificial sulfur transferase LarE [Verrucomicrobiota bacterium]
MNEKLEKLKDLIKTFGSCVVAYSGGVDSTFLAFITYQILGNKSLAVIADTPSLPRREFNEAIDIAKKFGFPIKVIKTSEFENPNYLENSMNRCYFCKHDLFDDLQQIARSGGYKVILYGENADDVGDFRPGIKAADEFNARAPLKEVGLTKSEIRELSRSIGLPTSDKPQMACLSTRIPYGEQINMEKLTMIEEAENILRDMGFSDVRVRHHELKQGLLARIEVSPNDIKKVFNNGAHLVIGEALKKIGYNYITIDLLGYRRGSMNEIIGKK